MLELPAYKACSWMELHRITEIREGCVWKTENTGYHIPWDTPIPAGYTTAAIRLQPDTTVKVNPLDSEDSLDFTIK